MIPLALQAQGLISSEVPFALHYFAAFGPLVAGLLLTRKELGTAGFKELVARITKWRVEPVYWMAAVSPILLLLIMAVLMGFTGGDWPDLGMLGRVDFLPDLGIGSVVLWLATYGFGEEIGWRGYLLPRLQRDRSAWSATLVLWAIWAGWHIPSFFYLHTVANIGMLLGFLLGILAGAVLLTWLYNSSGGSILIVAVWHGLFDYVTACTECKSGLTAAVISSLVMVWAVIVFVIYKPANLSRRAKQVLP